MRSNRNDFIWDRSFLESTLGTMTIVTTIGNKECNASHLSYSFDKVEERKRNGFKSISFFVHFRPLWIFFMSRKCESER